MIFLSWNCQGSGSSFTVQALRELKREYDPDFVFLMETKNKSGKLEKLRKKMGYDEGFYVEPLGLSGGLSLWWKRDMGVQVIGREKNLIDSIVVNNDDGRKCRIFWIYGAPIFEDRREVWEYIKRKAKYINEPWMCIGDFNDVASVMEKEGGKCKERRKLLSFQNLIRDCNLNEVHSQGQFFTWFGIRDGELIKERLDRVLVNFDWMEAFPDMQVFVLPAVGSDHSPIVMNSVRKDKKGPRRFKFENTWMDMEECE
ncbi:hypothetical protein REPUB_Repub20aG0011000 [Reevesia pubescens]